MKAELGKHWDYDAKHDVHELRLIGSVAVGIAIFCANKTFLFTRANVDDFGVGTRVERFRPWPSGLRHKRRLRDLKDWLIAQYILEGP
jgi:hypothetical protein